MSLHAQNLARRLPIVRAEIINVADLIITIVTASMDHGLWASTCRPFTCLSPKRPRLTRRWQVTDHSNGLNPSSTVRSLLRDRSCQIPGPLPNTAMSSAPGGGGEGTSMHHCRRQTRVLGQEKQPSRTSPVWHRRGHTAPGPLSSLFSEGIRLRRHEGNHSALLRSLGSLLSPGK